MYGVVVKMVDVEMAKKTLKRLQLLYKVRINLIKYHVDIITQPLSAKMAWFSLGAEVSLDNLDMVTQRTILYLLQLKC
jgi:hypothetical protein